MPINEAMKWPTDKEKYDREYDRLFGRRICSNCGYMKRKDGICTKCFEVDNAKEKRD